MYNSNKSRQRSGSGFGGSVSKSPSARSYNKFSKYKGGGGGGRNGGYRGRGFRSRQTIDISKFIKKASNVESKVDPVTSLFTDFDFSEKIQENLKRRNFINPTPIQDKAISHILSGKDVVGLANTGTGKTGAFLLPLIHKVAKDPSQKVLIIAPTRELCMQIENEFRLFAFSMNIYCATCIGGVPIFRQIKNLQRKPNFIIGTPGRLEDLEKRNNIQLKSFNNVVVDEIDRMLDMGFVDIITTILNKTDENRQSLFFSATMPESIGKITTKFLRDPITISVQVGKTADNVDQDIVRVKNSSKIDTLKKILGNSAFKKVLVFSETKRDVEALTVSLRNEGFKVDSIHGDKRQQQRQRSLLQFRDNRINILVATDVAARGLDIKDITHVINYTIPRSYDDYVHRVGRTGRGNSKGNALTFV